MKEEYSVALQCKKQTLAFDGKAVLDITVETPCITPENKRTAKLNKYYAKLSESFCEWAGSVYYDFVCDDYTADDDRRKRFRYGKAEASLTYEIIKSDGGLPTVVRRALLTCRGRVIGDRCIREEINPAKTIIKHLDFNKKM